MKKIYVLIILLVFIFSAQAQVREWVGGSGAWTDASKWTPAGVPGNNDIVLFKNISATISNIPQVAVSGLVVIESDIVLNMTATNPASLVISDQGSGSGLEVEAGASLTLGNNVTFLVDSNTPINIAGMLVISNGSRFHATNATHGEISGVVRNSGEIKFPKGIIEMKAGAVYEHAGDKGTIPSANWNKNATCLIKGVVTSAPEGLDQVFGNYIWDCEHQKQGSSISKAIPSEILGDLIIKKAGVNGTSNSIFFPENVKIGGKLEIAEGICTSNATIARIELAGDLLINGGGLKRNAAIPNSTIQIRFVGNQPQVYARTGGSFQGIAMIVTDKAHLDLGESVIDGEVDFIVENGARLMIGHPEGIAVNENAGAIQVSGKRVFSSDAEYAFTGHTAQQTGNGLPEKVRRLIIDNSSGILPGQGVTLSRPTLVTQELILSNGYLETSSEKILTIAEAGLANSNERTFVAGPIRKKGSDAFVFPTGWAGTGGGRIPIGVKLISGATEMQAEYKRASAIEKGRKINAPLHHVNYCEYWELFPIEGTARGIVTMYYNAHSNCSPVSLINDFSSARVARSNGVAWTQIGNADDSLNDGNGYVISDYAGAALSKEERFYALGNITNATDPLPVMFDNVQAYEKNNGVNIEWSNLTERDIAIYYVERSENGLDYTIIGHYLPTSNKDDKARYTSFDPNPLPGTNFYRIKVIERSTKIIFSKVMRVEMGKNGQFLQLHPNPVVNKQVMISLMGIEVGKYELQVVNAMGQQVSRSTVEVKGPVNAQTLMLPATTPPGVYSLVITGANLRESKMFIVQ